MVANMEMMKIIVITIENDDGQIKTNVHSVGYNITEEIAEIDRILFTKFSILYNDYFKLKYGKTKCKK